MERGQAFDRLSDLLSEVHHALMPNSEGERSEFEERLKAAQDLRFRLWQAISDYRDACVESWKC